MRGHRRGAPCPVHRGERVGRASAAWVGRAVLSQNGLRPARIAAWFEGVSPWAATAALEYERAFIDADAAALEAELKAAYELEHGLDASEAPREVTAAWSSQRRELWRRSWDDALPARLADSDDPKLAYFADTLRDLSHALPADRARDVLLDEDALPAAQLMALMRWCGSDRPTHGFDRAALAELRSRALRTTGGELAVKLGSVGLSEAWARGDLDEVALWLDALEQNIPYCETHGRFGSYADDPRLAVSFDDLPPAFGPAGFEARARRVGAQAGLVLRAVDCARYPCVAYYAPQDPDVTREAYATQLQRGWEDGSVVDQLVYTRSEGDPSYTTNVSATVLFGQGWRDRGWIAEWRSQLARGCLSPMDLARQRAALAEALSLTPQTWIEALSTAALACHRIPR